MQGRGVFPGLQTGNPSVIAHRLAALEARIPG